MTETVAELRAEIRRLTLRNKKLEEAARTARQHLKMVMSAIESVTGHRRGCVDPDVATMEVSNAARESRKTHPR